MFTGIKSHIFPGPKLYGLEVFAETSRSQYKLLEIKRSKNELTIVSSRHFMDWDQLMAILNKKIPICLVYNTKAILHKIVPNPNNLKGDALLEKGYPNIDSSRFFYNQVQFGTHAYIALLAKNELQHLLERFQQHQFSILRLSLGVSAIVHLRPHIVENDIETASKIVYFSGESPDILVQVEHKTAAIRSKPYPLNGLEVAVGDSLAFGATLGQFQESNLVHINYGEYQHSQKKEFSYARAYQVMLWPLITFFIILLLGNTLAFTHYFKANDQLSLSKDTNSAQKDQLVALSERVSSKEKRVQTILSNKNSRSSHYLDEIALRLPENIALEQLIFQPLSKPVRETKEILIESDQLLVTGVTRDAEAFSLWINNLEALAWVVQVETRHYGYLKKERSDFQIKITIQ